MKESLNTKTKTEKKALLAGLMVLLISMMLLFGCANSSGDEAGSSIDTSDEAVSKLRMQTTEELAEAIGEDEIAEYENEWALVGIVQSYAIDGEKEKIESIRKEYVKGIEKKLQEGAGKIPGADPTDIARVIITLNVLGGDPADVGGYDLTSLLNDEENIEKQGWNAIAYTLIAAHGSGTKIVNEEVYIEQLMWELEEITSASEAQEDGEAKAEESLSEETDEVAIIIQALSLYTGEEESEKSSDESKKSENKYDTEEIKSALQSGISYIGAEIKEGEGEAACETAAQVSIAEVMTGEEYEQALEEMLACKADEGFCHIRGEETEEMATEQALLALVAIELGDQKNVYEK